MQSCRENMGEGKILSLDHSADYEEEIEIVSMLQEQRLIIERQNLVMDLFGRKKCLPRRRPKKSQYPGRGYIHGFGL